MNLERKWIKPSEAARQIGVSKPTIYRMLPRLAREGVEIFRPAERVTLMDAESLNAWMERQKMAGSSPLGKSSTGAGGMENE